MCVCRKYTYQRSVCQGHVCQQDGRQGRVHRKVLNRGCAFQSDCKGSDHTACACQGSFCVKQENIFNKYSKEDTTRTKLDIKTKREVMSSFKSKIKTVKK